MFKYLLVLFFCYSNVSLQGQDFSAVDNHARSVDDPPGQNLPLLVQNLTQGLTTDTEKVRAFYVWIASHIAYDVKEYETRTDHGWQGTQQVLKRKKAVCEGYSNLFAALCTEAKIKVLKVIGKAKDREGNIGTAGHAWNLVKVEAGWRCIDATWGAGYVSVETGKYVAKTDESFFLVAPEKFIKRHWPEDPLMQMLPNPMSLTSFDMNGGRLDKAADKAAQLPAKAGFEAIGDSLDWFYTLKPEEQRFNQARRILRSDKYHNRANFDLGIWHFQQTSEMMEQYYNRMSTPEARLNIRKADYIQQNIQTLMAAEKEADQSIQYFDLVRNERRVTADSNTKKLLTMKKDIQTSMKDNESWLKKAK
jgi:Transglutaminase-like superfamily